MQMKGGSFTKLTFTIVCMKEALYEKVFKFDNFSRTYLLFLCFSRICSRINIQSHTPWYCNWLRRWNSWKHSELQNEYPDAVQITIYGYYEVPEPTVPEIAPQYVDKISKVNKTTTQYNVMTKNEFIISVAKGQTIQLSSTTTFSLEANSTANSREYRIKFYENQGTYTAVRQFGPTGMGFEEISGTWSEPVKYLQYSIDHRVS